MLSTSNPNNSNSSRSKLHRNNKLRCRNKLSKLPNNILSSSKLSNKLPHNSSNRPKAVARRPLRPEVEPPASLPPPSEAEVLIQQPKASSQLPNRRLPKCLLPNRWHLPNNKCHSISPSRPLPPLFKVLKE